ncbi:hypothetical protein [Kocuria turfanensis]|uniref:hypothetical protein n=1 Tax=Kocuria turfanensis TaxID=388357 RepID=UPI000A51F303|nr:hypothetical protein [Kocuria turfanensis]
MSRRMRWFYAIFAVFMVIAGVSGAIEGHWWGWGMIAGALMMAVGVLRLFREQHGPDR